MMNSKKITQLAYGILAVTGSIFFIAVVSQSELRAVEAVEEAGESLEWMTDFEAAKTKARAENKALLLDFTGSDWCGWCIKLKDEVFTQAAFKEYAAENLILVELDFPRNKPQSEALVLQNETLAEKYAIRGFPTILILSPDGELVEKTGYKKGGAENYVQHLKSIIESI